MINLVLIVPPSNPVKTGKNYWIKPRGMQKNLPAWLKHATRGGRVLQAGSVVTTGTWCGILHAQAGDTVTVKFDGIGEARVTFASLPAPAHRKPL